MTNPTSNYGFVLPTSTDLVTDLPADFEVALQGVDTRLKALQPGTTLGDIAYSSATANTNTRLPIGTSGQVLAVSGGGVPAWTTTADVTPLTTKGDLFTFTTADARLGVGTDGQTLVANSSTSTGLEWQTPSSGALTLIKRATTTGAVNTGTTFDSVFTSTYKTYLINIEGWSAATGSDTPKIQLRVAGVTTATSYYGVAQNIDRSGSIAYNSTVNQASLQMGAAGTLDSAGPAQYAIYANRVGNSAQKASLYFTGVGASNQCFINGTLFIDSAQTYDGFILSSASNITVTAAVYGLATA